MSINYFVETRVQVVQEIHHLPGYSTNINRCSITAQTETFSLVDIILCIFCVELFLQFPVYRFSRVGGAVLFLEELHHRVICECQSRKSFRWSGVCFPGKFLKLCKTIFPVFNR